MFTMGWCLLVYNLSTRPDLSSDPGVRSALPDPTAFMRRVIVEEVLLVQRDAPRAELSLIVSVNTLEVYAVSHRELAIWKLIHERTHLDLLIYDSDLP
jgi:hypothetical protein